MPSRRLHPSVSGLDVRRIGYHHFEHHCLVNYSIMKIAKCPSIVLKLVDDELSKVEYGVLQKGKSLSLAIALGLIVLIIKLMEGG
jgi:hypothetical protein